MIAVNRYDGPAFWALLEQYVDYRQGPHPCSYHAIHINGVYFKANTPMYHHLTKLRAGLKRSIDATIAEEILITAGLDPHLLDE